MESEVKTLASKFVGIWLNSHATAIWKQICLSVYFNLKLFGYEKEKDKILKPNRNFLRGDFFL